MTSSQERDDFDRHPTLWTVAAVTWVLENPDLETELMVRSEIKDPAKEVEVTRELETVEAQDLEHAIAAAHELLDRHADQVGEYALEIYVTAPQLPHADQERLGIRHYKLSVEARKQARAIGIRGRDIEARVSRMVRHAVPFDHRIANLRFRGILLRLEDDIVTSINLAIPPHRRRKTK